MAKYPTIKDALQSTLLDWGLNASKEVVADFIIGEGENSQSGQLIIRSNRTQGLDDYSVYVSDGAIETEVGSGYMTTGEARAAAETMLRKDFPQARPETESDKIRKLDKLL